jgi:hypothetical protein
MAKPLARRWDPMARSSIMQRSHGRSLRFFRFQLIAALLIATLAGMAEHSLAQQNTPNSYVSPTYGYSIAWPMPWYVASELSDGTYDSLVLADDQSSLQLLGARLGNVTAQAFAEQAIEQYRSDPELMNFEQLPTSECPYQTDGFAACYRYDAALSDGSVVGATSLFEARDIGGGVMLRMVAGVREPHLAEYLPKWASLVVAGPGEQLAAPTDGADWETLTIDGATYRIEPGVPALDRDLAIEGIEFARRTLRAAGGAFDIDRLTITVRATASPRDPYEYGMAQNNSVFIYTGSKGWREISPIERLHGLVHEYVHLYQFDRLELGSSVVPTWFIEGAAEAFGYLAISQLGVTNQMDFIQFALYRLGLNPVPGTLCSYAFEDSIVVEVYPLAYLAIQDLLARNGLDVGALVRIFEDVAQGASFETAFKDMFGVELAQFCTDVEAWRTRLPLVDVAPPDLQIAAGQDLPGQVTLTSIPEQAAPGEQLLFTAATTAGANCHLSLTPGKRSPAIAMDTFANGSGEAFWLFIVPPGTLPGEATVEIGCGGDRVLAQFTIT